MAWGSMLSLFFLSFIKFMFAPFAGPKLGLTFIETYLSIVTGGIVAATIFYFSADFFMKRTKRKRIEKEIKLISQGKLVKRKKNFSRMNKFVLKIKRSLGQFGISMWAPFFLSVPIGSIIAAKFYGNNKKTFPIIIFGMFVNGLVTTSISYLIG